MKKIILLFVLSLIILLTIPAKAQFNIEGDFRVRWYADKFYDARDNRGDETYMRYLGRLKGMFKASREYYIFN